MMTGLVWFYVAIAILAAYEGNYARVLYWCSAAGITVAVLWGSK